MRHRARAVALAGLVVVGVGVLAACRPGEFGPASVAYTTDRTATAALEQRHLHVSRLTCSGRHAGHGGAHGGPPAPGETTVVSVDCRGETDDGLRIVVTGLVTGAVDGACVRGNLTAQVGGRQVFRVGGLGDCSATPGPVYRAPAGVGPAVTVTVTRTVRPVPGK
jgi:hypothetical protein